MEIWATLQTGFSLHSDAATCIPMRIAPRERLLRLFESRIYNSSFKDLSGWDLPTIAVPFPETSLSFSATDLRRYIFDHELPNSCLESAKLQIATLTSLRERAPVFAENLLLTPGATAALAVILHFLRARGIEVLLADPPFYFSIEKLCESLGIKFVTTARSLENLDDHSCLLALVDRYRHQKKALVLSHPRYVISRNYPRRILSDLHKAMNGSDFLIIDQAVDLEFENCDNFFALDSTLIKVRTIGKALGLNGSRLATIVAGRDLIEELGRQAGMLYGSLDVSMLKLGALIAQSPEAFKKHLGALCELIKESVSEARLMLGSSVFEVVGPENGFLGYIIADSAKIGRYALYQALLKQSIHAIFAAHMGLRRSQLSELIRVNFLLDIRKALVVLKGIGQCSATSRTPCGAQGSHDRPI